MMYVYIGSFMLGSAIVLIRHGFKVKKERKALAEQMMMQAALREKSQTEVQALCTTFGFYKAYEIILDDYKIRHGIY